MMDARSDVRWAVSTLGCPEWDASTVVRRVSAFGFDALEWRGGPDGTVRTAWSKARRAALRRATSDAGLAAIAVTAYPNLISGDPRVVGRSIDHIEAHAVLARDLDAPWVRIFVGIADDDAPPDVLAGRAVDAIATALERTSGLGVGLAIEPHDDHARSVDLAPLLEQVADDRVAVVWDLGNAWAAGESPRDGFEAYRGRIAWTQVKDGTGRAESWRLAPVGGGEVPIVEALELLRSPRATTLPGTAAESPPVISLEWERAWHPELEPAETAFPAALAWLRSTWAAATAPADR